MWLAEDGAAACSMGHQLLLLSLLLLLLPCCLKA